jgi:hypothetical protein
MLRNLTSSCETFAGLKITTSSECILSNNLRFYTDMQWNMKTATSTLKIKVDDVLTRQRGACKLTANIDYLTQ